MKIAKKTAAFLLVLFLGIQGMPLTALAADGTLSFSDPTAKAGETIEVTVKINTAEGPIGDGQVQVTYDPTYLEFVSGVNATGEAGTITLSASGNGIDSELAYSMTFKALAEGETTLQAVGYTAYTFGGEELNLTLGTSAVKIEAGDGTQPAAAQQPGTQTMIELDGKQYFIADDIPEALIPEGYEKSQLTYEGSPHTILVHTGSGQKMIYLMDTQGEGNLFLYDSETDHFSAFEKIDLSSDSYILITDDKESANIPEDYEETTIQINGKVFPAWQNVVDTKLADFCLVYAVDNAGKKGLYQYDSTQKTYQRFLPPTAEKEKQDGSVANKVTTFVEENLPKIMVGAWGVFLMMLLLIVILAVKLRHRNEELDDYYDQEYDENPRAGRGFSSEDYDESDDDDYDYEEDYDESDDDDYDYEEDYDESDDDDYDYEEDYDESEEDDYAYEDVYDESEDDYDDDYDYEEDYESEDAYDDLLDYYDDDDDYELEREILDEDEGFFDKRSGKKRGIDLI